MKFLWIFLFLDYSLACAVAATTNLSCEELQRVLDSSQNHFESLKGDFDFGLGEYSAKTNLNVFRNCSITVSGEQSELVCRRYLSNATQAESFFSKVRTELETCVGTNLKVDREKNEGVEKLVSYEHQSTFDEIGLRLINVSKPESEAYSIVFRLNHDSSTQ